ncbi:hypothetical protein GCM10008965_10310 [Methylorubrum aminovorans]|nr:hypothetical protein GCM10025880_61360 [Methylorubrum aminovorans]
MEADPLKIVRTLETIETDSPMHPVRRVVVVERNDGFYCHAQQYYFRSEYEGELISEGWHTISFDGIYETPEMAEIEGRASFAGCYGVEY